MAKPRRSLENYNEIKKEVDFLIQQKKVLTDKLDKVKGDLAVNQDDAFELIDELEKKSKEFMSSLDSVTNMIRDSASLNQKRSGFEQQLSSLEKKLDGLTKIHRELAEIWRK